MFKFEKLEVYNKSLDYIKQIYLITKKFPSEEKFGLVDQLRRASVSITTNIAEGSGRYHKKDYIQFLRISRASLHECIALLKIALDQNFIEQIDYHKLYHNAEELAKMISGLSNSIDKRKFDKGEEL